MSFSAKIRQSFMVSIRRRESLPREVTEIWWCSIRKRKVSFLPGRMPTTRITILLRDLRFMAELTRYSCGAAWWWRMEKSSRKRRANTSAGRNLLRYRGFAVLRKVLRHGKGAAGGSSFQKLCLQINGNILFGNLMLLCIAGEHQGQSAVAGYVAGGSEAVLKGKRWSASGRFRHRQISGRR